MNRRKTVDLGYMTVASLTPEEYIIGELHKIPKSRREAAVRDLMDKRGLGMGNHRTVDSYEAYVHMLLGAADIHDSMMNMMLGNR